MKKVLFIVGALVILSALLISGFIINKNLTKKPSLSYYVIEGQKAKLGFIKLSEDEQVAMVVGKVIQVSKLEDNVYVEFEFQQGIRQKVLVYSKELPSLSMTQQTSDFFPPKRNVNRLNSQEMAFSAYNMRAQEVLIIFLDIENKQINPSITTCNKNFIALLRENNTTRCVPWGLTTSVYQP